MNSVFVIILGIIVYYLGVQIYAKFYDQKVIKTDPKRATPARLYADGVDFLPTSRNILFGYQFKSIAGAAPVLGPIIAIKWGWLPALLWILLGTFFIGWIQDYTSAIVSMRSDGMTFGGISYSLISSRARVILLSFIYFYLLLIASAFTNVVAVFLSKNPNIPLSIIFLAFAGILVGFLIYYGRLNLILVTIVGLFIFYLSLFLGAKIPLALNNPFANKMLWLAFALIFSFFGSVLPIWVFVQPINYLSFYIILFGMVGAVLGIFIGRPNFSAPPFTNFQAEGLPLWPMLFVTIACGAISGWHSNVSSTGTSRQLEKETDTRAVTAGAMFLEMILALIALIIVSITKARGSWDSLFGEGLDLVFSYLGLPKGWGKSYGPVMIVILAITILHLVIRFMRIATNELLGKKIPALKDPVLGTVIAIIFSFVLVYTGSFNYIWVLFGSANQLMASLALLIASVWLVSQRKPTAFTFYPMVFMYLTTMSALIYTSISVLRQAITGLDLTGKPLPTSSVIGNYFAGLIGLILFFAALILAYDGLKAYIRYGRGNGKEEGNF
ncbi:MAG: carbon starvation CstA family protein [candidate division WOR-3 bacterium]